MRVVKGGAGFLVAAPAIYSRATVVPLCPSDWKRPHRDRKENYDMATDSSFEKPTAFLRKASGVVRAWSPFDSWMYNVLAINIITALAMSYLLAVYAYPGGDIALGMVICGIFCIFEAILYSLLTSAMPRTGGDYVFQSRILSGFVAVFFVFAGLFFGQTMWMGIAGWWGVNLATSPYLLVMGQQWGIPWMVDFGNWLVSPWGVFLFGMVCITWGAYLGIKPMSLYAKLQKWFFFVGVAGAAAMLIFLAVRTNADFIANFNTWMSTNYGVSNAYQSMIDQAKGLGFSPNLSFSWGATFAIAPVAAMSLIFPAWSVFNAGEIRRADMVKSNVFQMVFAEVFAFLFAAVLGFLLVRTFGAEFLASSAYLYYNAADVNPLPVLPMYGVFVAALGNSPWVALGMLLFFHSWFWLWYVNVFIAVPRFLLAMSLDRVLPAWLGQIHPKSHTPVNGVIFFYVVSILFVWAYAFTEFWRFTLAAAMLAVLAFGVTAFAGAVFPYLRKEMYNGTVIAKYKIGGVPLITISGAIFVVYVIYLVYVYLTDAALGVNDKWSLMFIGGYYIVSAIIYFVFKLVRKSRESLDIGLAYREIPPE
jgi:basic amino acid/polyamine antiporter, APA family